jgi:hypothetical protein
MRDDNDQERAVDTVDAVESGGKEQEEDAADLPRREAMSLLLDPSGLLGGGLVPTSPTAPGASLTPTAPTTSPTPPTPGSDVSTPAGPISVPQVPTPSANPGGTYNPDAATTSQT